MHEIRASLDHLRRASEQLGRFRTLWRNSEFREYFGHLTRWAVPTDTPTHTCIVTGNRMFTGYRMDEHPIRSVYELTVFLTESTVQIDDQVRRFWQGEHITPLDLINYLDGDLLHKPQLGAMTL